MIPFSIQIPCVELQTNDDITPNRDIHITHKKNQQLFISDWISVLPCHLGRVIGYVFFVS